MKWTVMVVIVVAFVNEGIAVTKTHGSETKTGKESDMKKAKEFMEKANEEHLDKMHEDGVASFNYSSNITDANKKIKVRSWLIEIINYAGSTVRVYRTQTTFSTDE